MDTQHTPTPWVGQDGNICSATLENGFGKVVIAKCYRRDSAQTILLPHKANAAFIVRACNVHEELVTALKAIDMWMKGYGDKTQNEIHRDYVVPAIAKAEGK